MPASRRRFRLSAAYIEIIHDSFVSVWWPNLEPVGPEGYRDHGMVASAVTRPFQTAFSQELFPTVYDKAAALFHSLIATHPFDNGNKRTAVIALDLFLTANGLFLYLANDLMYELARDTASYVPQGISHEAMVARISKAVKENSIPIVKMKETGMDPGLCRSVRKIRLSVRRDVYNVVVNTG